MRSTLFLWQTFNRYKFPGRIENEVVYDSNEFKGGFMGSRISISKLIYRTIILNLKLSQYFLILNIHNTFKLYIIFQDPSKKKKF